MKKFFRLSNEDAHSQDGRDDFSFSGIALPSLDSRVSAHARIKGAYGKASQNSVTKAMTKKENELSQQLQKKEAEILGLRAELEVTVSRTEHEKQNLLHNQTTTREALERKNSNISELQNYFKGTLDEKDNEIEALRGNHNRLFHTHESQLGNSRILQQNAEAAAGLLQEKLTVAE